jgi:hypothetical protein
MPIDTSIALMARETRVRYGSVPDLPVSADLPEQSWRMTGGHFLLRGSGRHYFHYAKGEGITVERGPGADLSEESLWLNGTIYSAIAAINGLVPLHASAIARGGRVIAFAGDTGAGKSTIVAALSRHGFPMFCDDTLVLDLSDPAQVMCLPGHKRLKLTPEGLALTGASREEKVGETIDARSTACGRKWLSWSFATVGNCAIWPIASSASSMAASFGLNIGRKIAIDAFSPNSRCIQRPVTKSTLEPERTTGGPLQS